MADTAIWSTFSWPRANILSARALSLVLVWLVLAFGLCFACSCDQNVRACLLVSSRRYFYKVPKLSAIAVRVPGKGLGRASVGPNNSDVLQAENVTPLADALDTA